MDLNGRAVDPDLASVELVDAADALDEGRLAGTVVTEQGEYLTGADLEVDAVEGDYGAEGLGCTTNTQDGFRVNGGPRAARSAWRQSFEPRLHAAEPVLDEGP